MTKPGPTTSKDDGGAGHVVTQDAVILGVEKDQKGNVQSRRFLLGARVKIDAALNDIEALVRGKAIKPYVEGEPLVRTTALEAMKASGAADDPVKAPDTQYLPVQETAPGVTP